MTLTRTKSSPSPNTIIESVMSYRSAKVLLVAVTYDIFTLVHQGYRTVRSLAAELSADVRALEILLDALAGLHYLKKEGNQYFNTEISDTYLVKGRPGYLGNNLKYQDVIWEAWSDLKHVVKKGEPQKNLRNWINRPDFLPDYIKGMANIATKPANEIASHIEKESVTSILDIGAGPGAYSLALLKQYPEATATLLDLTPTVEVTKTLLKDHEERERISFIEGNYHTATFGVSQYDVVIMSHITHDEGEEENKRLIKKSFHALRPGGILLIHDFMTDDRTRPAPFSALFSVHMLVYTEKGKVYSLQTYSTWLEEAGFRTIKDCDIAKDLSNASKLLIATR